MKEYFKKNTKLGLMVALNCNIKMRAITKETKVNHTNITTKLNKKLVTKVIKTTN
jgi:hypothetical protein